jgi:hypothetical protein
VSYADLEHSRARVGSQGPGQEPSPHPIPTFNLQNHLFQGGPDETRTRDLCHAKAALSQLSYGPKVNPGYTSIRDGRSKVVDASIEPASLLRDGPEGVSYRVDRSVHEAGHHEVPRPAPEEGEKGAHRNL